MCTVLICVLLLQNTKRLVFYNCNSADGLVVRACGAVHSGLILSRVKLMTLKLAFTTGLLDAQQ